MSRISIAIPHYNQPHLISRAIESLSLTCLKDIQLLVMDDASSDDVFAQLQQQLDKLGYHAVALWQQTVQATPTSIKQMQVSSCNILITKAIYQKMHGQLFDLQFGISGGEDTDFFHRAKALGAKFAYEGKALAYEDYDQLRATKSWVRKRSFRVGQTNVKIFHQNRSGFIFSLKIFARFLVNLVRLALLCWHPAHSIRYQMKICRQWGMLLAACGSS